MTDHPRANAIVDRAGNLTPVTRISETESYMDLSAKPADPQGLREQIIELTRTGISDEEFVACVAALAAPLSPEPAATAPEAVRGTGTGTLREALERIVAMCDVPGTCTCGRPNGIPAVVACARNALAQPAPAPLSVAEAAKELWDAIAYSEAEWLAYAEQILGRVADQRGIERAMKAARKLRDLEEPGSDDWESYDSALIKIMQEAGHMDADGRVAVQEVEGLRVVLKRCREALESLPVDALGEGASDVTLPSGESGEMRWPLRDELIDEINRALAASGKENGDG